MYRVQLFYLSIGTILLTCISTFGQLKNANTEKDQWNQGTIKLLDGRTIKGKLNYNFVTGVLSHKHQHGSDPYFARKVSNFILFDSLNENSRTFYSLPFKEELDKVENFVFFEVIYEKDGIAILSMLEYEYKERTTSTGNSFNQPGMFNTETYGTRVVEKIFENIYIANSSGDILKYAFKKIDHKSTAEYNYLKKRNDYENDRSKKNSSHKFKVTNKIALHIITSNNYETMMKFTKTEQLKLNTIEELIKFFDYYSTIK